jgi:predicted  nucleic acid-binding Zn-ribbon protein
MAKKVEFSVEDRLRALYDLQLIHSRIDKIRSVRGELPLEVEDLEDEVAGLEVRISKLEEDSKQFTDDIKSKEIATEHAKTMIKKYNEQQKNVRNNRAFESLSKEIEFQELEIELCAKQTKELQAQIELKKQTIEENNEKLNERKEHLKHKKNELGDILKETEKKKAIFSKNLQNMNQKLMNPF